MKSRNFYTSLVFIALFVSVFIALAFSANTAKSADSVPVTPYQYKMPVTLLNATTTNATSTNLSAEGTGGGYLTIAGAKKVVMYFQRGGATSPNIGTSTFKVQVSNDGATWYDFGLFKGATSTTAFAAPNTFTNTVILGTGTGSGTTTVPIALDLTNFGFFAVRCIVVETVDGEHTCKAAAES